MPDAPQTNSVSQTTSLDSYSRYGDIRIEDVRLVSMSGLDISIVNHFAALEINEDLFSNNVSGRISIIDAINFQNLIPLSGNEFVRIVFRTPSLEQKVLVLHVDKISERIPTKNQQVQIYDLNLISPLFTASQRSRISKSYTGKISDIVKAIHVEHFGNTNEAAIGSPLTVEDTTNEIKIVVPNWKPFNTINWLAKQAVSSKYNKSDYVFYQDIDGHKFVSLSSLYNAPFREVYEVSYTRSSLVRDSDGKEVDIDAVHRNIQKYAVLSKDHSKAFSNGVYCSTTITHDLVTKAIKTTEYKYSESFDADASMNKSPVLPRNNDLLSLYPESNIYLVPQTTGVYNKNAVAYPSNRLAEKWVGENNALLSLLNDTRLLIEVEGDTNRRVGDKVAITIPNATAAETEVEKKYDNYLSGFYIITKLTHIITGQGHTMKMEVAKESNIQPIPDSVTFEFSEQ